MKKLIVILTAVTTLIIFGCSSDEDNGNGPDPEPQVVRLVADTMATAPLMTGVDEAVWSTIDSVEVTIGGDPTTYGRNPNLGQQDIVMKAIRKDGRLFIWVRWHDASANITADAVRCSSDDANTWERVTSRGQDVFSIIIDAQNNGDERADCATMCHTNTMQTTGGGNADAWKWLSTATAPGNMADDVWIDNAGPDDDNTINEYVHRDNFHNALPMFKHPDTIDFEGIVLYLDEAVTFEPFDNINIAWPTGYEMPGYVIDSTIFNDPNRTDNSLNDVRAISHYDSTGTNPAEYTWTVVFERALNTTHAEDVNIGGLDSVMISIAVTHNDQSDQVVEHSGAEPFWLILEP